MISGIEPTAEKRGKLLVAFSDDDGSSVGVEFSSTTQKNATAIMGVCVSTFGEDAGRVVTSSNSGDTSENSSDGGDNMDKRIAVLESDVAHIKSDITDIKVDNRKSSSDTADIKKDVAVILQKLIDIDEKVSKKPSTSEMTAAIASAVNKQIIWTIVTAIGVLGLARWIF